MFFLCALVPMEQEHHNGGTGPSRDGPTSTQGAEATTCMHTSTIAMIIVLGLCVCVCVCTRGCLSVFFSTTTAGLSFKLDMFSGRILRR